MTPSSPVWPPALSLLPTAAAPGAGRRFVREALRAMGRMSFADNAALGVSELVSNACIHARTGLLVALSDPRVQFGDDAGGGGRPPAPVGARPAVGVRIEVSDTSPVVPRIRVGRLGATTGRGLAMLDVLGSWGIERSEYGKTIWFEPFDDSARVGRILTLDEEWEL